MSTIFHQHGQSLEPQLSLQFPQVDFFCSLRHFFLSMDSLFNPPSRDLSQSYSLGPLLWLILWTRDGCSTFPWNVSERLLDYMVLHPRKHHSSAVLKFSLHQSNNKEGSRWYSILFTSCYGVMSEFSDSTHSR
jgi:hypothetical protein